MKRRKFRSIVAAGALLALSAASAAAASLHSSAPTLGVDPLIEGTVMEGHADALGHWVSRGISGAVLLHVDTHDDLRTIGPAQLAALRDLAARDDHAAILRAGRPGKERLFNDGQLVRAAAGLGVVREVVWLTPFTFFGDSDAAARLAEYLRRAGFAEADIATFRAADGCHRGTVGGLPLAICAQERLPPIAEPVLLSIDADFFPFAAKFRGLTALAEIREFFSKVRAAGYRVRDTVFAHSVLEGFVNADQRWVGEAVLQVLRDPGLSLAEKPPERWDVLEQLTLLDRAGGDREMEMLGLALPYLERWPHDAALLLFAAEASVPHGGGERALAYADEACRMDRGYCVGLREIGLRMLDRGNVETGLSAFEKGEQLLPGMEYGQFDKGFLLMKAGRPEDAAAAFEELIAREGAFPGGFLIGAIRAAAGDRAAARRSYDAALEALGDQPGALVSRLEVVAAVRGAATFYRQEGLAAQAEQLERDPRLRRPAADEGP